MSYIPMTWPKRPLLATANAIQYYHWALNSDLEQFIRNEDIKI